MLWWISIQFRSLLSLERLFGLPLLSVRQHVKKNGSGFEKSA
jgi:hypothetical protein